MSASLESKPAGPEPVQGHVERFPITVRAEILLRVSSILDHCEALQRLHPDAASECQDISKVVGRIAAKIRAPRRSAISNLKSQI